MTERDDPWPQPFAADEFAGRTCLITGAAQGMGAVFARRLGELGATVVIADLNETGGEQAAQRLREAGILAHALPLDVRDGASIEATVAQVEKLGGRIDVLINNAGLCIVRPSVEVSEQEWDLHLAVMLTGAFRMAQRVAPGMLARGVGSIVNICSVGAYGGWPQRAAYNSAKGGLRAMTEQLASEWAPAGIRVNGVAPAVTLTDMARQVIEESQGAISLDDFEGRTPIGRVADPDEMAQAVLFMASDRSARITGQTLAVDGGWLAGDGYPRREGATW